VPSPDVSVLFAIIRTLLLSPAARRQVRSSVFLCVWSSASGNGAEREIREWLRIALRHLGVWETEPVHYDGKVLGYDGTNSGRRISLLVVAFSILALLKPLLWAKDCLSDIMWVDTVNKYAAHPWRCIEALPKIW